MPQPLRSLLWLSTLAALVACDPTQGGAVDPSSELARDDEPATGDDDKTPAPAPSEVPASPAGDGYRNALNLGVDDDGAPLCSGSVATDTFRYGLCVCGDLAMAGELVTSSFRSSDPDAPDGEGGGVGVNGRYTSSGGADIGGSLVVGGKVSPVGEYAVAGELRAGQGASVVGDLHVGQDAYVAGDLVAIGMSVDGTLYTTEALAMSWGVEAGGSEVLDFAVDAPCGCDDVIDVAALVLQAASDNDNEAAGLEEDSLDGFAGGSDVALPPGRYYLSSIHAAGDVVLRVSGPTALFVDGDVSLAGRLEVALEDDSAELDLWIAGSIHHAGQLELGSSTAPARVRTYVGGDGDIAIAGDATLGGALYAPNSRLAAAGELTFEGAVLVGSVADAGRITVRYDADLQDAEDGCTPTDEPGDDDAPGDDEGPADGADLGDEPGDDGAPEEGEGTPADDLPADEGSCETFMDCASPLVCLDGTCTYIEG